MNKFAKFIVKHKILIVGITVLLCIASIVAMLNVNVNSDILSYLPEGVPMTDGMNFLRENFGMEGDAIVGVANVDYATMKQITDTIAKEEGIKEGGVIWIGTLLEAKKPAGIPSWLFNFDDLINGMKANQDLLNLFYPTMGGEKRPDDFAFTDEVKAQKGNYMVMLQLNVATSSQEALDLITKIDKTILADYDHAVGGSTKITKDVFDSTIGEIWKYLLVAILVMFIILLCATTSLTEPFIFMITLGISILINMGTNIILPSVSVVTFAASSILQLGLSMDYAIFLMHAYSEEREKTLDENLAMQRAIPKTFSTISSSAMTTVFGFLALFFMQFKIGGDLGIVLAKGVFLSLLTVLIVQPCLMLMTNKLHNKLQHKIIVPKLKGVASFSIKNRKVIVTLAIIALVPCIIMQNMVDISYIKFVDGPANPTEIQKQVDSMSNSIIAVVPVNPEKNYKFLENLKKVDKITATMGMYNMVPENIGKTVGSMIENGTKVPGMEMLSSFANNGYTMYSIMLDCDPESPEAAERVKQIHALFQEQFGDDYYMTGMSQAVEDLKLITPRDFAVVSISSVLLILVVLLIAFRSVKLPIILIAVIEFGIFVNLSFTYMLRQSINFMAYIIISSIQLGATVDYAILYTVKYQRYLDITPAKEAGYRALRDSGASILTSVAIMAGCCLSVALVTSNRIVGEITLMIARGAVVSGVLTLLVLPAVLVSFTGNKKLKKLGKKESKRIKKASRKNPPSDEGDLESTPELALADSNFEQMQEIVR